MTTISRRAAFPMIVVVGVIAYLPSINAPFYIDDFPNIVRNPLVAHLFERLGGVMIDHAMLGTFIRRIVCNLTFAVNYSIGGPRPFGFHVVNLIIHITNGMLVYLLVTELGRVKFFIGRVGRGDGQAWSFAAFAASLIFVSHPIQTQAVTYIVERYTSLAAFFYLGSLVAYLRFRSTGSWPFYALSLMAAVLAMGSKEIAFTLPVMIALVEFLFCADRSLKRRVVLLAPFAATMLIIPVAMIFSVGQPFGLVALSRATDAAEAASISRVSYFLTQMRVIATYLGLIFVPIEQTYQYHFPLSRTIIDPQVVAGLLLHLLLVALAVRLVVGSRRDAPTLRLVGFGILWFYIALAVESSFIPIRDVIFEHRVYLPLVGILFAVVGVYLSIERHGRRRFDLALLMVLVGLLSFKTIERNRLWADPIALARVEVSKVPDSISFLDILARSYLDHGQVARAEEMYERAKRFDPSKTFLFDALLAQIFASYHDDRDAARYYASAYRGRRGDIVVANNLGVCLVDLGRNDEAIEVYRDALAVHGRRKDIDLSIIVNNLVEAYLAKGDRGNAREALVRELAVNPGDETARDLLARLDGVAKHGPE